MSVSVSMPQLGESVTEGTVTRWLKKEGERVEVDEPLLEVSTDKVDTEIPSPASGILRSIAVDEDETVAVGAQLAIIEDSETSDSAPARTSPPAQEDVSAPPDTAAPPQDAAESAPAAAEPEPVAAGSSSWSAPSYAPPAQQDAAVPQAAAESAPAAAEPQPASRGADGWSAPGYTPPGPATPTPGYAPPPSYGQAAARSRLRLGGRRRGFGGGLRHRGVLLGGRAGLRRRGVAGLAVLDDGQLGAHRDRLVLIDRDGAQDPGRGRGDFGVHLVRRHLQERLIHLHALAFLLQPARDGALGDALTELRHGYGDRHSRDSFRRGSAGACRPARDALRQ